MTIARTIPFSEIDLDRGAIYGAMGSWEYVPDPAMRALVEGMIAEIALFARPCYLCNVVDAGPVDRTGVTAGGVRFSTGRVIAPFFAGTESIAAFVATTGVEFGQWLHEVGRNGDILEEFVADAIGSAFAEAVTERMAFDLERRQQALGGSIGNRYSPGYCGWSVRDQRGLFSLLPPDPCGVTLNGSCLMSPIKSVSGLIPLGPAVEKHPYGCDICDNAECFRKILSK